MIDRGICVFALLKAGGYTGSFENRAQQTARGGHSMIRMNRHYAELKESYLFYNIAQKTKAYL